MTDQRAAGGMPLVVALPAEIDVANAGRLYERLDAALRSGVALVVADLTVTEFCDAAAVGRLLMIRARAAARGIKFRLVIPPGALPRRVLVLLGADRDLPVYASVAEACAPLPPPLQGLLPRPRPEQP